jgi:hypothetical protein
MCVHGLCYHGHQNGISKEIKSELCCFALRCLLKNGQVHFATEIMNITICPDHEKDYGLKILATSACCLEGDPIEQTKMMIEIVVCQDVLD